MPETHPDVLGAIASLQRLAEIFAERRRQLARDAGLTETLAQSALAGTALAATARAGQRALPSLTPFPTPSPLALPDNDPLGLSNSEGAPAEEDQAGLLGRITGIDTSRFSRAFWAGVRIAAFIFAGLAVYWLLRGLFRLIKRYLWARR